MENTGKWMAKNRIDKMLLGLRPDERTDTYKCPICGREYRLCDEPDCNCLDMPQITTAERSELEIRWLKQVKINEVTSAIITDLTKRIAALEAKFDADEARRKHIAQERMFASRVEYARQEKAKREARK